MIRERGGEAFGHDERREKFHVLGIIFLIYLFITRVHLASEDQGQREGFGGA